MKTTLPNFLMMVLIGIALTGCMTTSSIDEILVKLDEYPQSCTTPTFSSSTIEPLPKEKLLGEWKTQIITAPYKQMDGKSTIKGWIKIAKGWGFLTDGSCYYFDTRRFTLYANGIPSESSFLIVYSGQWTYENSHLSVQMINMHGKLMDANNNVIKDDNTAINSTKEYNVFWYGEDEIDIREKEDDVKLKPQSGSRKIVTVDSYGVKTERDIKVTGIQNGKEIGSVTETVVPPMRYRRKQDK